MISKSISVILFIFICVTVAQDDTDQPPVKEDLPQIVDEVFQEPPIVEVFEEPTKGRVEIITDGLRSVGVVARKISAITASLEVLLNVIAKNFIDTDSQIFNLFWLALYLSFPI